MCIAQRDDWTNEWEKILAFFFLRALVSSTTIEDATYLAELS